MLLQKCEARLLEPDIVVLIYGIEADDVVAVRQQAVGNVKANESRGTSY